MDRKFKTEYSIKSVDLTFLVQAFAEQYEKQLAEKQLPEKQIEMQVAT
jgi:hypothetical protein